MLHLDHSTEPGGAELALARLLRDPPWLPVLALPRQRGEGLGAFDGTGPRTRVLRLGPRLPPGGGADDPLSPFAAVLQGLRILHTVIGLASSRTVRRTDVIHANTTRAAAYGALLSMLLRKPLVVHLRDRVDQHSMGGTAFKIMTRIALPSATSVIANSESTAVSATPFLTDPGRMVVIYSPSGVVTKDAPAARLSAWPLTFGLLGRLTPWKGQEMAIQAFAAAFADDEHVLEIAGAPLFGQEDYLERLRITVDEHGLAERVHFLGHVATPLSVLAHWDVGLHASMRAEPMGQILFQYMAAGCAIVAPSEGGPAEILTDGADAVLFEPRNPDSMAEAMQRVVSSDFRRSLTLRAVANPKLRTDSEIASLHDELFAVASSGR